MSRRSPDGEREGNKASELKSQEPSESLPQNITLFRGQEITEPFKLNPSIGLSSFCAVNVIWALTFHSALNPEAPKCSFNAAL